MRHIRIPLLAVALSLMVTGMAFAFDVPDITTWISGNGCSPTAPCPGLSVQGVGSSAGTGFGDLLISPLYDVRNLIDPNLVGQAAVTPQSQATLIAIVNTDQDWGVLARLRFREWKRSFECLDLDIVLTTNDVWVAQVLLPTGTSTPILNQPAGAGSRFVSVVPPNANSSLETSLIPSDPNGIPFSSINIETGDITRCQYGYYEVIGEERIGAPNSSWVFPRLGTVVAGIYTPGPPAGPNQIGGGRDVANVLMGTTYIVRVAQAISHQFNMVAIANFAVDAAGIWSGIGQGTTRPNLRDDVQGQGGNLGAGGLANLEGLLSKRFVDFQYVAQGAQGGYDPIDTSFTPMSTSVVVTFPTKWIHYNSVAPFSLLSPPFTGFRETKGDHPTDYGEIVTIAIYDRSEHPLTPPGCAISPCPQTGVKRLPYEVNIVGLKPIDTYSEDIYDFRNNVGVATSNSLTVPAQKFFSGWAEIDMSPATGQNAGDPRTVPQGQTGIVFNFYNNFFNTYRGLPAIGIVMTEFFNATIPGYYGNTVPWQYGVDWRRVPPDSFTR